MVTDYEFKERLLKESDKFIIFLDRVNKSKDVFDIFKENNYAKEQFEKIMLDYAQCHIHLSSFFKSWHLDFKEKR